MTALTTTANLVELLSSRRRKPDHRDARPQRGRGRSLSADGTNQLWFELGAEGDVETQRLTVALTDDDLRALLTSSTGDDVMLALNGEELDRPLRGARGRGARAARRAGRVGRRRDGRDCGSGGACGDPAGGRCRGDPARRRCCRHAAGSRCRGDDAGREADRELPGEARSLEVAAGSVAQVQLAHHPPCGRRALASPWMGEVYATGSWKPFEGQEEAFLEEWKEFMAWACSLPGAGGAVLARDLRDPERYVSFSTWDSIESVKAWKSFTRVQAADVAGAGAHRQVRPDRARGRRRRGRLAGH